MGMIEQIARCLDIQIHQSDGDVVYDIEFVKFYNKLMTSVFANNISLVEASRIELKGRRREEDYFVYDKFIFSKTKNGLVNVQRSRIGYEFREDDGDVVLVKSKEVFDSLRRKVGV